MEKVDCCGCGACEQVCPKECIELKKDEEGFLYPNVAVDRCVDCDLCRYICPILNCSSQKNDLRNVFAARAVCDDIRNFSSSGGVFALLAHVVLEQNGVVFGASFDDDFTVHHILVESAEQLQHLRGSKYLQSRIENTFIQARNALEQGRPVLFSGVGCQIAGLKSFLKKEYPRLYTVDVLCHGVPSPEVWRAYLNMREHQAGAKADAATFRSKENGWHHYETRLHFDNGYTYTKPHEKDMYIQLFLSEICLRPSCYSCRFREGKSGADITLGDAWGIEKWLPELDDDRGSSLVLINSEKGLRIWENICGQTEFCAVDGKIALAYNTVYMHSVKPHPNRAKFFEAFRNGATMKKLMKMIRRPLWKMCASFLKKAVMNLLGM